MLATKNKNKASRWMNYPYQSEVGGNALVKKNNAQDVHNLGDNKFVNKGKHRADTAQKNNWLKHTNVDNVGYESSWIEDCWLSARRHFGQVTS